MATTIMGRRIKLTLQICFADNPLVPHPHICFLYFCTFDPATLPMDDRKHVVGTKRSAEKLYEELLSYGASNELIQNHIFTKNSDSGAPAGRAGVYDPAADDDGDDVEVLDSGTVPPAAGGGADADAGKKPRSATAAEARSDAGARKRRKKADVESDVKQLIQQTLLSMSSGEEMVGRIQDVIKESLASFNQVLNKSSNAIRTLLEKSKGAGAELETGIKKLAERQVALHMFTEILRKEIQRMEGRVRFVETHGSAGGAGAGAAHVDGAAAAGTTGGTSGDLLDGVYTAFSAAPSAVAVLDNVGDFLSSSCSMRYVMPVGPAKADGAVQGIVSHGRQRLRDVGNYMIQPSIIVWHLKRIAYMFLEHRRKLGESTSVGSVPTMRGLLDKQTAVPSLTLSARKALFATMHTTNSSVGHVTTNYCTPTAENTRQLANCLYVLTNSDARDRTSCYVDTQVLQAMRGETVDAELADGAGAAGSVFAMQSALADAGGSAAELDGDDDGAADDAFGLADDDAGEFASAYDVARDTLGLQTKRLEKKNKKFMVLSKRGKVTKNRNKDGLRGENSSRVRTAIRNILVNACFFSTPDTPSSASQRRDSTAVIHSSDYFATSLWRRSLPQNIAPSLDVAEIQEKIHNLKSKQACVL